jgi:hypothetical protein
VREYKLVPQEDIDSLVEAMDAAIKSEGIPVREDTARWLLTHAIHKLIHTEYRTGINMEEVDSGPTKHKEE